MSINDGDGRRDFDFYHGKWTIENRRLRVRLQGSTEWEKFDAAGECRPVLGGLGNVDSFSGVFPDGAPIEDMTLRIFNPATRLWSIYWADDRACQLLPPVHGIFTEGVGRFTGTDVCNGQPVDVVFNWYDITPTTATWSQAFSADGGATWELNWEMFMTRET